jgi:threonine/homoserine/homoserine lactone efflux protein
VPGRGAARGGEVVLVMMKAYFAFATIAALVVISPGPATFLVLKNTPTQGRCAGLLNTAGIVTAVLSHATLSLIGVSAVILASPVAFHAVKLLGAAYLFYLGAAALSDTWQGVDFSAKLDLRAGPTDVSTIEAFAEGWLINILNPKPSMFYLSIFPQFIDPLQPFLAQALLLTGIHATICATWFSCVVVGIDRIKMMLRQPMIWRSVKGATGLILIGLSTGLAAVSLS